MAYVALNRPQVHNAQNSQMPREALVDEVRNIASRIATQPRFGLVLTKQACNHIEDLQGKTTGIDAVFGMHHFAHAQNSFLSISTAFQVA